MKTSIYCECKICNNKWNANVVALLQGSGCPECGKRSVGFKKKKSHEVFVEQIKKINSNIKIISQYINDKEKVTCECLIDGTKWEGVPSNMLSQGANCPTCIKKKLHDSQVLSQDEFVFRIKGINKNLSILSNYYNWNTKVKFRCNIHNEIFEQVAGDALSGKCGCKKCIAPKGEKKIIDYLKSKATPHSCKKRKKVI